MRVLITGATGFLGEHLLDALEGRGHTLRAVVRGTSRTEGLTRRGLEVVRCGLEDPVALRAALDGVEAIVHAAGGGIAASIAEVYRANAGSTRALLDAAGPTLRRFVLVSSLAAHGPSRAGAPAAESEPDAPRSHYGRSKLESERAALARDRLEVVVVRPPALYGPGEHRMVDLFRAARRGFVPMVRSTGTISVLHGADCASALALALEVPAARGVYYVAEPRVYARREMAAMIARAVGREARVIDIPIAALRIAARGAQLASRLTGRISPLSPDKVLDLEEAHQACDPSRAIAELGWSPRRSLEDGLREAYEDYQRRGWL